jgi:hypothetical protein
LLYESENRWTLFRIMLRAITVNLDARLEELRRELK